MVKKVFLLMLSAAIIVSGYLAFNRLNYWERSIRIVKFDSSQPVNGRMGRGGFEARGEARVDRPDFRQLPDSIRQRVENRERRGFKRPEIRNALPDSVRNSLSEGGELRSRNLNMPDSLRREFRNDNGGRPGFEAGIRGGSGHGRGNINGQKISLGNVWWFLAVFASFTVIVIYIDKLICFIRKRKRISVS